MVFYTEDVLSVAGLRYIPTELWFKIYSIEHSLKFGRVLREIVNRKIYTNDILDIMDWGNLIGGAETDEDGELEYNIEMIDIL